MFPNPENRVNGTWFLFPIGHEGSLLLFRMMRTPGQEHGWRANGSFPKGAGRLSEKSPARHATTAPPGRPCLGARASRPHPVPLAAAELQCDAAGSHPVGGNRIGQAEGEPWRRSPVDPSGGDGRGCARLGAGGTPALPGSHHPMTGHEIEEAFWCRLWLKEVHLSSGLFVFIRVHSWFIFIH